MKTNTFSPVLLNNGLKLRFATKEDAELLATFNHLVHDGGNPKDERLVWWTRDLFNGEHPTFVPEKHCTIVEDVETKKIVSSMLIIPQTWSYAGINFPVGRPELVGTLNDYRNQGLVRKQFEVLHQVSEDAGHLLQAITGIPYYYRLFGYEMTVDLDGYRKGYGPQQIPILKKEETEKFTFKPAVETDAAFLETTFSKDKYQSLLNCERSRQEWIYEIHGKSKENVNRKNFFIIYDQENKKVGVIGLSNALWKTTLAANFLTVSPDINWAELTPSVLRFLWQEGKTTPAYPQATCDSICLAFGANHPSYQFSANYLSEIRDPYAWYIRIPDLAKFIQQITPVLTQRLENSDFRKVSKELKIGFYKNGLSIKIEDGKITTVTNWPPPDWEKVDAAFPGLTFLQLLLGHRTTKEIKYAFPDAWYKDNTQNLLDTLFPKKPSSILPFS